MSERKRKPLAAAEASVRQFLLMMGFGFMAFIAGSLLSASLIMRLKDRVLAADSVVLAVVVQASIGRLWVLAVLPVMINLACRFLELPIWRTAIIGGLSGELFLLAIQIASVGTSETFADPLQDGIRIGTLVGGILISVWAGNQGKAWAAERQKVADVAAAARKSQYDEFLAQSKAQAEKNEKVAPAPATGAVVTEPLPASSPPGETAPVDPKPTS